MSWFSEKPSPAPPPPPKSEKVLFMPKVTEAADDQPLPNCYLRMLREPLYDTEWCIKNSGFNPVYLFMRPMGQPNMRGDAKTEIDTNMLIAGQLPIPMQFDWHSWRTEFSPNVSIDLIRNFRFCSRLEFLFGDKVWFSVPLSFIPFAATVGVEELRSAMSVLVVEDKERFEAAWAKAKVVTPEAIDKLRAEANEQCRHEIYRTELARNICNMNGRPWRIRSAESFSCRLTTNWGATFVLPGRIAVRLYLEGYLYRAV